MSKQKRTNAKPHVLYRAWKSANVLTKGLMTWLLRGLFVVQRPDRFSRAGFVLPTVVMVTLVVTLLTTAVMVRSFDRAQSASNYRVNQEVLNAALPALDRAKAKITALLADNRLGTRGTPSEIAIDDVLRLPKFVLGDETRLKLIDDINNNGTYGEDRSQPNIDFVNEELTTNAWRFPVDTDNNGLFDSFTLYSILFRTPSVNAAGDSFERSRSPLEARALPLDEGSVSGQCSAASGTSASLVGNAGWFLSKGQIKKSFFVYVSTVPITNLDDDLSLSNPAEYEVNRRGGRGFSAIEYQQDQARIPLSNNAVLYNDDLDIVADEPFRINGRVFTNSNLFVTEFNGSTPLEFYQVSSKNSCFYDPENAKILVGGNVTYGTIEDSGLSSNNDVRIDLYNGLGVDPVEDEWDNGNDSVTNRSSEAGYNTQAYEERIAELARLAKDAITNEANDPQVVKDLSDALQDDLVNPLSADEARDRAYDRYFRERTRRVPYEEVPQGSPNALNVGGGGLITSLEGLGVGGNNNGLRPPDEWIYPFDRTNNSDGNNFSELALQYDGNDKLEPPATEFETLIDNGDLENHLGDRVLIGNNLPELQLDGTSWVGDTAFKQEIKRNNTTPIKWNTPENDTATRERQTRVETLDDLGDIGRDGFWETKSATDPPNPLIPEGGLRIVTGAGVYLPPNPTSVSSTSSVEPSPNVVIWPDTMPVIPGAATNADPPFFSLTNPTVPKWFTDYPKDDPLSSSPNLLPFLRMRASAVYHYHYLNGSAPIACVDNYYDPTNSITAVRANNGKVYEPPLTASESGVRGYLNYLANQVYPNGRPVNQILRDALYDDDTGTQRPVGDPDRTLAEQAAVDAAICGLYIFDTLTADNLSIGALTPTITPVSDYELQDGAIREIAFLDPRQIKAIDAKKAAGLLFVDADPNVESLSPLPTPDNGLNGEYKLPVEQREPLEVRATVIDIERLRLKNISTGTLNGAGSGSPTEYMVPNSGIIYATRNDALTDLSDINQPTDAANERVSANDFLLDPTRRPSAIMLEKGKTLGRRSVYSEFEKGLTVVSNLPVYVKGEFNPHENASGPLEEFNDTLDLDYNNFYDRNTLNPNFACRTGDPRLPCPVGDQWRVANILSDATTLLSEGFQPGTRADGDFDLRNNQTDNSNKYTASSSIDDILGISTADSIRAKRLENGFLNNDFAVNGLSSRAPIDHDGLPSTPDKEPGDDDYSRTGGVGVEYVGSSYFNNFVTPVQRRVQFPEYVMEICRKLPVSECEPNDWVIGYDLNNDGALDATEEEIRTYDLVDKLASASVSINAFNPSIAPTLPPSPPPNTFDPTKLGSGTTTRPALIPADRRYARRVAFLRWDSSLSVSKISGPSGDIKIPGAPSDEKLVLYNDGTVLTPILLGIKGFNDAGDLDPYRGSLAYYPYSATLEIEGQTFAPYSLGNKPRLRGNTLWYRTWTGSNENYGYRYPLDYVNRADAAGGSADFTDLTGDITKEHPLLAPVLNIQYPALPASGDPGANLAAPLQSPEDQSPKGNETNWLQPAEDPSGANSVTFNMVMATGDVPGRPTIPNAFPTTNGEFNGGLTNLPRFMERWTDDSGNEIRTNISGSLIQLKRSSFATAPYFQLPYKRDASPPNDGPFNYPQMYTHGRSAGRTPYFDTPGRNWGFDVGLLSQLPDLLAQRFTLAPASRPKEFFREISRNDEWVHPLLCAEPLEDSGAPTGSLAINDDQRPDDCP